MVELGRSRRRSAVLRPGRQPLGRRLVRIGVTALVLTGAVVPTLVLIAAGTPAGAATPTAAAKPAGAAAVPVHWNPAYNRDFPDPTVMRLGGVLVAYSTQSGSDTVPAAVSTNGTDWTAAPADALPKLPTFADWGSTWAPSVAQTADGNFVMYFAASNPAGGDQCIGRATSRSPTGPFVDHDQGFEVCQNALGGSIDPEVFVTATGAWLLWKSDGNHVGQPTHLWSEPLGTGLELTGRPPSMLLTDDQPWQQGIIEGPDMVEHGGTFDLFYGGVGYNTADYAIGYATCATPSGPCVDQPGTVLASQPGMQGPGGPSFFSYQGRLLMAFAAWPGAAGYGAGGIRAMYLASVTFTTGGTPVIAPFDEPGYWLAADTGGVDGFGNTPLAGSAAFWGLSRPMVGIAATPDGGGYWEAAGDGGIFAFGDAGFQGSMGSVHLNRPVVGIAATPDGGGYWEVASDGGVFCFGDAGFHGSMGSVHLNRPVVGIVSTPDGGGYWEVASDGGVFAFGDAGFHGSMGSVHLKRPVVGIGVDASTGGYWEVASDGGVFAFDAPFLGSTGAVHLEGPVVGMAGTTDGRGYWLAAGDGGIFAFGDARFEGSAEAGPPGAPVVGMTSLG